MLGTGAGGGSATRDGDGVLSTTVGMLVNDDGAEATCGVGVIVRGIGVD